jgi:hypothetical protein
MSSGKSSSRRAPDITIHEDFFRLMEAEILPRRDANPTHVRLDGEFTGGNCQVAGRSRHNGKVWKIHANTHYEPLLQAYNAEKTDATCDPFIETPTKKGTCLVLNDNLRKLMSTSFRHMFIYEEPS